MREECPEQWVSLIVIVMSVLLHFVTFLYSVQVLKNLSKINILNVKRCVSVCYVQESWTLTSVFFYFCLADIENESWVYLGGGGGGTGGKEASLGFLLGHLYWMYCKLLYNKNIAGLSWVCLGGGGTGGEDRSLGFLLGHLYWMYCKFPI